ncbi:MAG: hypothetical protein ACLQIQ_21205 [Beijerinckiaceae bacterium]
MDVSPILAGVALIVLGALGWRSEHDLSLIDASLALLGAALIAAPVIAKIKFSATGIEFETNVKAAASKLSELVDQHGAAIKAINDNLIKLNESIEALQKALSEEIAPKKGTDWESILSNIRPKTIDIGKALRANTEVISTASDLNQKVRESIAKLR